MANLTAILTMIKSLGAVLKNLFLGLFLYRSGQNKEIIKAQKKGLHDAKEANKIKDRISKLSDDELDKRLRRSRPPKE